MDKRIFRRLVAAGFLKNLTLSIAGMVDCAIVGRFLGAAGLSAMKLALPVFSVLSLFSSILGTGLSVSVSRDLTRGNRERADITFQSVLTVSLLISAACMLVGFACPSAITTLLAGNEFDPAIFVSATVYLSPILISALPILFYDVLGTLAMLEGADRYIQCASLVLPVVNVLGDLIAVRLNMGLRGIAAASGIAYACACCIVAASFLRRRSMFRLKPGRPDVGSLRTVVVFGAPMVVKGLCGILWPLSINRLMLRYGTVSGLAALSIQDAVHYLPASLCSGIASATLIMTGIYAGEQDEDGLRKINASVIRWSLIGGLSIALCLGLAALPILRLFSEDAEVLSLGVSALRLYLFGVPFFALNLAASSYLQGLGRNRDSAMVIFLNHILISISSAFFLARLFGTKGIFASYGICEVIMAAILILNVWAFLAMQGRRTTDVSKRQKTELRRSIHSIREAVDASMQVNRFCLDNGISPKDAHHIALCTEELAVNSLEHGFNDRKRHHLELRSVISEGKLLLRLRDDGRRFDIVERYKMINPDDPTRNIGLRIVFANAEEVSYSSALNMNHVCVKWSADPH